MCDNSVDYVIAVLLVRMGHFDLSILNDLDDIGDLLEHQYNVREDNIQPCLCKVSLKTYIAWLCLLCVEASARHYHYYYSYYYWP